MGLPVERIRSKPAHRSWGEPRTRAITRSDASIASAMDWWPSTWRDGLAQR